MRGAVTGSACAHLLLVATLWVARGGRTIVVPGPDVVQVALVDAAQAAPSPPAPRGVRIEKPPKRPRVQRAEVPPPAREEPRPAPPAPAAASARRVVLPYADVAPGLSGQVAVDDASFEFAYWLQQVRALVARGWSPSAGVPTGSRVTVYFRVARDGTPSAPVLEQGSGNAWFDQSALRAVLVTGPMPPLPLGYAGSDLGVHFGFEYTGP